MVGEQGAGGRGIVLPHLFFLHRFSSHMVLPVMFSIMFFPAWFFSNMFFPAWFVSDMFFSHRFFPTRFSNIFPLGSPPTDPSEICSSPHQVLLKYVFPPNRSFSNMFFPPHVLSIGSSQLFGFICSFPICIRTPPHIYPHSTGRKRALDSILIPSIPSFFFFFAVRTIKRCGYTVHVFDLRSLVFYPSHKT